MTLLQLKISPKVRTSCNLTRFFIGLVLITIAPMAHAVGTPSTWEPKIFKNVEVLTNGVLTPKKRYEFWGGWFGSTPYLGSTGEESANYYCEVRGLGAPHHSGEIRSDGRYYFKCPNSSRWQSGIIKGTHDCDLGEQVEVIDLDVHTAAFLVCPSEYKPTENTGCDAKNKPTQRGNPCSVATGNKFQSETDFSIGTLKYTRAYNSEVLNSTSLGVGWQHNFQKRIIVSDAELVPVSGNGRGESWIYVGGVWQGETDSDLQLMETTDEYEITLANGVTETYNKYGQILFTTDSHGNQTVYTYSTDINSLLESVTDHYGNSIQFVYDGGRISQVVDPNGEEYNYKYDLNNNLAEVVYPDDTPLDDTDNPSRIYHYEDSDFPNHLTGITDENGDRIATYAYDANGKAVVTEHAQTTNPVGQEQFLLNFEPTN